ncbi:TetR/AcrR family transcriptional regulator [Reichenbachiella ulvae]|uniref:TetR/AcrR family transcriptional regulator n=1 Tax=Reichenbachiella ulvae TaxID=2980104 RepID=A0ABT3CXF7_9BACT|nr:TetR/AcrR family transcriptional regulator [Reichenbachiella ulvae]MCV9388289.1 TetR/AcrR family transcriptional regulator [Reichenbachiella ulvae]
MPKAVTFDRAQVIDNATQLFWKKGFHATSMQDLVDATGLNRSSLYNSFGDKHDLFEICLKEYQIWQSKTLSKSFDQDMSPMDSIRDFFSQILKGIKEDADHKGCLLSNCATELSNSDPHIQELLIANKEATIEVFDKKLKAAKEAGELKNDSNSRQLAMYLYTCLHGLQVTALLISDQKELDALVDNILKNL